MNKKKIAVIALSGLVVILCAFSPLFLSDLQNRQMLGKVYLSEKENDGVNRTKISLLQKIELFQKQMEKPDRDESFDHSTWVSGSVWNELQNIVSREILPIDLKNFLEMESMAYSYWIPTDEKDNHIMICKTVVKSEQKDGFNHEPYVILWVEPETGKIIGFKARWISFSEEKLAVKETLAEKWGLYLGTDIKVTSKSETTFEYRQGDTVVEYEIIVKEDEYKILPVY